VRRQFGLFQSVPPPLPEVLYRIYFLYLLFLIVTICTFIVIIFAAVCGGASEIVRAWVQEKEYELETTSSGVCGQMVRAASTRFG
jgi:uncharacterized membrane protein